MNAGQRVEFRPLSIDTLLRDRTAADPDIGFSQTGAIDCMPREGMFSGDAARTREVALKFEREASSAHGFPVGLLTLRGIRLVGPSGLMLRARDQRFLIGESVGWGASFGRAHQYASAYLAAATQPNGAIAVETARLQPTRRLDTAVLASAPGFAIYGHWLIDVLPRLRMARGLPELRALPRFRPRTTAWMDRLEAACGIPTSEIVLGMPGEVVEIDTLHVPTYARHVTAMDRTSMADTWTQLADGLRSAPDAGAQDAPERVYVSRSRLKQGRALVNAAEVEQRLQRRGYFILHPQEHPLPVQAALLARARVVAGEDGSGLHNCVYAPGAAHVVVIGMGRANAFHAGIVNCTGQRLSFLDASDRDATNLGATATAGRQAPPAWRVELDALETELARVETEVAAG